MRARAAGTDRLGTLGAALLAVLGLSALDVVRVPFLPTTARGFLSAACTLLALLLLAVALPAERPRTPALRAAALLLAGLPALLAGSLLASGDVVGPALPGLGLLLALAATLGLGSLGLRARRGAAAVLLGLLGVDVVLAHAGLPILPASIHPVRAPLLDPSLVSTRVTVRAAPLPRGPRPGAYVRVADGLEPPLWRLADEGPTPRGVPVLRGLVPAPEGSPARITLPAEPGTVPREVALHDDTRLPEHAYDLGGVEAVRVGPRDVPPSDAGRGARAALEAYVRMGGGLVLVGEPDALGTLGPALHGWLLDRPGGPAPRPLGLGLLAHAPTSAALPSVLAGLLERPRLRTAFDGAALPPGPPGTASPDVTEGRLPLGLLLVVLALLVGVVERGATSWTGLLATLLPVIGAAALGVVLLAPRGVDLGARAAVLEVGGAGGRRLEAVWLEAGERGYSGAVALAGPSLVRAVPGQLLGRRLEMEPGATGWLVVETPSTGRPAGAEDRSAGWLASLLVGDVAPARLRFGRGAVETVQLEGVAWPDAARLDVAP